MHRSVIVLAGTLAIAMAATGAKSAASPAAAVSAQSIVIHRNAGSDPDVRVTVGIPLPPGALRDPKLVRILDDHGAEVPAAVQTTLRWYAKDGSVRAVRAQFLTRMEGHDKTFYFALGQPRERDLAAWPYADGLVDGEAGFRVPAVLATLTPSWLCDSLVAGPQLPAAAKEPYANYVAAQFRWARKLPVDDSTAWLFDRPSTLYKAYVRTGRFDYLQAADLSYRFYMKYIRRDGLPVSPSCAGGWTFGDKPCDVKYVYVEPVLLAVALTGDDTQHDAVTIDKMMTLWENGGWNRRPGPYRHPSDYFTERLAGLGLLQTVSAYELTGDRRYMTRIDERVTWLYMHQRHNPDGLGDDGSWRNSWNLHENDAWDPATDVRGNSPWMSENIIDGLWHAWLVTGDVRIPQMITDFGRYMEGYGWIDGSSLTPSHDWRNPCSGGGGQIAWYWSSSHAERKSLVSIQESDGWYSDAHNVELGLAVAAAYYFERDPKQSQALKRRFEALSSSYAPACAAQDDTLRRFNWNNRGSAVAQWMIHQAPGSGLAASVTRGQP
jgi:hypothetical protein